MKVSLAYLGPTGTNSETAALTYASWLATHKQQEAVLCPYPSIVRALNSVASRETDLAVVPVENSIEGSVTVVLDAFWQSENLQILEGLTLPIVHGLLSYSPSLEEIEKVYSHPQALSQCQKWLEQFLPHARLIAANSTTEALQFLKHDLTSAAIAAPRAAKLYRVPLLARDINDRPDNHTRFWAVGLAAKDEGNCLSLAFSLPENVPGALVAALQIFALRQINLSKIESRPTKRSLGEYIFFVDLVGNLQDPVIAAALKELLNCTERLKIFGNYDLLSISE